MGSARHGNCFLTRRWGGGLLRGVFAGCREGLGAGYEVGGLRFYFGLHGLGARQFDFYCAVGGDFSQEDGSPRRHLDVADVHALEDDREPDGGQEEDLRGPKLGLFGDFSQVQRGRRDEGGRRGGLCGRGGGGVGSLGQGACEVCIRGRGCWRGGGCGVGARGRWNLLTLYDIKWSIVHI